MSRDKTFAATAVLILGAGLARASVAFTLGQWILERFLAFEGETLPLSARLHMSICPFRAAAWIG
jgi:hypothetical protein